MAIWKKVASENEFDEHTRVVMDNGTGIALFKLDDGIYAINDQCSHAQGSLSEGDVYDGQVECPQHGAMFDIRTGKNLSFPAVTPVKSYPVKVENGDVYVELD
ncbi:non-heme iron oxygenase ferredoxin subunit [candidate division KSB1 bacterium]|nr:non-heme iron oxygenase ferredoxin subunit [candidate division KSB1 bacterium]